MESPKNQSKEDICSSGGEQERELTIEEQQQLNSVIRTLKDTNQISQSDFVSFTTFMKNAEKKSTFDNLINSLKIGNCSLASYRETKDEDSEVTPERNTGNNSDSFVNIMSELNRRNIHLNIPSSTESSSESFVRLNCNTRQSAGTTAGTSREQPTESTDPQPDSHINLREFLTRELEKRINSTPNSCDSMSSSLIKSLFGSITDKQKTSTPMYDETSSSDKTINDLFSISTVTVHSK